MGLHLTLPRALRRNAAHGSNAMPNFTMPFLHNTHQRVLAFPFHRIRSKHVFARMRDLGALPTCQHEIWCTDFASLGNDDEAPPNCHKSDLWYLDGKRRAAGGTQWTAEVLQSFSTASTKAPKHQRIRVVSKSCNDNNDDDDDDDDDDKKRRRR